MTAIPRASGSGPLFDWVPKKSGKSGTAGPVGSIETIGDSRGVDEKSPESPSLRTESPEVRTFSEKKSNDSGKDPRSGNPPLKGGDPPDFFPCPSDSSAALTLRSQRTGQEGSGLPESDRSYKLNAPVSIAPTLRPYQVDALAGIDAEFARGVKRTLVVKATGLGKTVLFARWAQLRVELGRRVLVLAHRTELLTQAQKKLRDVGVRAAIEQADKRAGNAPVVVASVQTLRGKRLEALDPEAFDIVIDEAHHANAASYRKIVEHFPGARVLGVTATPDRGDGQALGEIFESVAFRYEIREGIAAGYLVPIRARQIHVEGVDLSSVRSRAGDLATDELAAIMATEEAVIGVVDPLLREVGERPTMVFCVDVAHALAVTEAINRYRPGAAGVGYGDMTADERAEVLGRFERGEIQFLVNCQLWTEGFDCPRVACVATVRPTKSRAMVVQQVGRGTRLLGLTIEESRANGKPDLLWLDFTGNAGRHKLVGPIDALAAGEVDDDVRAEADRILAEEEMGVDEALDEAARRLEERRRAAKITANARYFASEIDPFLGEELGPPCLEPWAKDPATPDQIRALIEDIGLKKIPPQLNQGEATRIIGAHLERRKRGLCSYKQSRLLAKFGIDASRMSKAAANARISVLAGVDWDLARARPKLQQIAASELITAAKAGPS